jgi:hypothetical protein
MSENQEWQLLITDVDGFWNEETQPLVQGKVVSTTIMMLARRETPVAILQLTAPAKGVQGSKDEKETIDLVAGQAIGVVIKHKLQDLYRCVENQNEVQIKAKEKIDLDNGNTLWRYVMRYKGRLSPIAAPGTPTADRMPSATQAPKGADKKAEADAKAAMDNF